MRTYSELIKLPTFEERFRYLKINGEIGLETFGSRRYLNQKFYNSDEWKQVKKQIIIRDQGWDLGIKGRSIGGGIYVHHIEPITLDDLINKSRALLDPENLICTGLITHNAIHYGDETILISDPVERTPFDTCPWRLNSDR